MSLHRIIGLCSVLSSNKQPDCYSELSLVVANLWDTVMKIQTFCLFSVYISVFLYQGSARPDFDHRDRVGVWLNLFSWVNFFCLAFLGLMTQQDFDILWISHFSGTFFQFLQGKVFHSYRETFPVLFQLSEWKRFHFPLCQVAHTCRKMFPLHINKHFTFPVKNVSRSTGKCLPSLPGNISH